MMKHSDLLVSIVVPMYNAEKFVRATLESILQETTVSIEVIVVDDKSTDHSVDRVREFKDPRVRVIEGMGRGAPSAMNTGYGEARAPIIMCCDSDDLFPDGRIRQQAQWLESHPDFQGICGNFSTIDSKGSLVASMQCGTAFAEITNELANGQLRTHFCTYAIRSSFKSKVGPFREFFQSGYDIDYQLRMGEMGRIAYVPDNAYFWRLHSSSITHTQSTELREFFERAAHEMQRQRKTSGSDDLQRGCPPSKPGGDQSPAHSAGDHIQEHLLGMAWREHQAGNKVLALRTGIRAVAASPLNIHVWKSILTLLLKPPGKASP
jgi:glycosyltransferase involved in cell wall biosynthesis